MLERTEVAAWLYVGALLGALFGFLIGMIMGNRRHEDNDPKL